MALQVSQVTRAWERPDLAGWTVEADDLWLEGISNLGYRKRDYDWRTDVEPRPLTLALSVSIDPNFNLFFLSYGLSKNATHLIPQSLPNPFMAILPSRSWGTAACRVP